MNKSLLVFLSLSLIGCAHKGQQRELVHFPYAPELLRTVQENQGPVRVPASEEILEAKEEKSTRRVYFTTLYHQHLVLGNHLGKDNSINSCPQFHHDKIEADSFLVPKVSVYGEGQVEEEGRKFFPELAFAGGFSLGDYHETLQRELEVLCEEGVSDNYFKFDNLITHHAKRTSFHMKASAMESVLKIPIFANFYLIKMIEARHELTVQRPEEKLFIQLSETHWFDRYVFLAGQERGKFLRNKMVKR